MIDGNDLFRAMIPDDDGQPRLDASARTLGARPVIDVVGDALDQVEPGTGGISVATGSPEWLPEYRRPTEFGGTGRDPVFAIRGSDLGAELTLRHDVDGPSGHGFVEPVRRMPFTTYQDALWATRPKWRRIEK